MAYGLGFFIAILCQEPIYGFGDRKTPHGPSFLVLGKGYEAVPVMERTVNHMVLGSVHLHHPQLHEAMVEWKQLALKTRGPTL